ncbi:MAG: beta strand repeat-containing protein [Isosphaeraceae bacterium]
MAQTIRPARSRRRRWLPRLERIEERILLSPFTVTNTNDSGPGSLRQAILDSNANPGLNTIGFAITGGSAPYVINVQSALPGITGPVVINGESQPGYAGTPIIEINGGGNIGDGLLLAQGSDGSTIEGLDIVNFPDSSFTDGAGIHIQSSNNLIVSNWLGPGPSGQTAATGNFFGVYIDAASNNTIGGAGALGNLISGNLYDGILIYDDAGLAQNNLVIGNKIGTDVTGTAAIPNATSGDGGNGIDIYAENNTIGGAGTGQGNLISGNAGNGIEVSATSGSLIAGDTIGTDLAGGSAVPNGGYGVSLESATNTLLQSDLISGNFLGGVQITGYGLANDRIHGSVIGTDRSGGSSLSNGLAVLNNGVGIFINGSAGNVVGGDGPGQGNLISGNATAGVYIFGRFAAGNTVAGNLIGVDATGSRPILTSAGSIVQQVGVLINQAPGLDISDVNPGAGNTIGGVSVAARNVISGNEAGIEISGNDSRGNLVTGNFIGPSAEGGSGTGNTVGVYINGAPGNLIGGGNVISGNGSVGVYILGGPSTGNQVTGNLIGVGPDGLSRLPNQIGVYIENAPGNVIGGTSSAARNVIAANIISGVYVIAGQSVGNVVESNLIGYAANGVTRLGNREYGVLLYNAANNNVPQRGPVGNRIVASGIANFREFTGRAVTANPPSGQSSRQRSTGHRGVRVRLITGSPTPRGPVRRKGGRRI